MQDEWFKSPHTAPTSDSDPAKLAWLILFGPNPYAPKRLLVGRQGNAADEDFWGDNIRGWAPPQAQEVKWQHGDTEYPLARAARIPYLVKSREGSGFYLDHLLVGYTPVVGDPLQSSQAWTTTGPGGPHLLKLGRFLIGDLWPAPQDTPKRVPGWDQPVNNDEGYSHNNASPDLAWLFREQSIMPNETLRITLTSAANERRYLLVGYEGGGGW